MAWGLDCIPLMVMKRKPQKALGAVWRQDKKPAFLLEFGNLTGKRVAHNEDTSS